MSFPDVALIVPVRNEAKFIERNLNSLVAQDYPHESIEIIVADGQSNDGTQAIVERLAATYPNVAITVVDNAKKSMPAGFNLALARARGAIIVMIGGHCEIAPDYVRRCVQALVETGADCVGGPLITVGETLVAQTIALAQSSPFGVGGVAFRTKNAPASYVDTVAFGAYRRAVFERIGNLDEELVRNQDDEFNFRLIQAGGKIWLDPAIRAVYYSRASLRKLWQQYFQYGLYKVRVIQKRGAVPAWRHLVPGIFVLGLLASLLLALLTRQPGWLLLVAGPYIVANILASAWTARARWRTLPLLPVTFLILHLAYGTGFLWGIWHWRKHGLPGAASVS